MTNSDIAIDIQREGGDIRYIRGTRIKTTMNNTCIQLTELGIKTKKYLDKRRLEGEFPKVLQKEKPE